MHAPASLQNQHIRISILTAAIYKGLSGDFSESMMMMMMGWGEKGGLQRQGRRDWTWKEMEKVGLQIKEEVHKTSQKNEKFFTLFTRRVPSKQNNPTLSLSLKKKRNPRETKKKRIWKSKKSQSENERVRKTPKQHWLVTKKVRISYPTLSNMHIYPTPPPERCVAFSQSPSVCVFLRMYQPNPFSLYSSPTQPNPTLLHSSTTTSHPTPPPHIPSPKQRKSPIKENQDEKDFPPRKRSYDFFFG